MPALFAKICYDEIMKRLFLYIFLSSICFTISYAGEGLKGVYYFDLVIEEVKNKDCKVTKQNIEREIKFVLANSPIKLKKDINIEAIYIAPTIVDLGSTCSGYIYLEIWQGGMNKNSVGNKYTGKQVSFDKGYIYTANISRFKDGYLNAVSTVTKDFVNKWREFN